MTKSLQTQIKELALKYGFAIEYCESKFKNDYRYLRMYKGESNYDCDVKLTLQERKGETDAYFHLDVKQSNGWYITHSNFNTTELNLYEIEELIKSKE